MSSGRTIVLAPLLEDAKVWCLEHQVAPYGSRTWLCSTATSMHAMYAMPFSAGDRLVILESCRVDEVAEMLYPALVTAPGYPEIATRIRDWFKASHRGASQGPFEHVFGTV